MLCRNPYIKGGKAFGCGSCAPCLVNRRRMWTHRIMLESLMHRDNAFVTLTYDDEHLPKGGSLAPEEVRDWLKRFRKSIEPGRVRYYAVGEYGETSNRPHYHVALFGYPKCRFGNSRYSRERQECCDVCDKVRNTWGLGNVFVGALETKSAQYVAGYVTKKMTRFDDPRLNGRHPEFCRMSLKPGIGADAMWDVASVLMQFNLVDTEGDVPSSLRHGRRLLPLGRYLRRKLRVMVGREEQAPEIINEELQALYDAAKVLPTGDARKVAFKNAIIDAGTQAVLNQQTRSEIFKTRKKL